MTTEELIELKKKQPLFWQEEARNKTCEAGKAVREANKLEREVRELQSKSKTKFV